MKQSSRPHNDARDPQGDATAAGVTQEGLLERQKAALARVVCSGGAELLTGSELSLRDARKLFSGKTTFIFGETRQDEHTYRLSNVRHPTPTSDVIVCSQLIAIAARQCRSMHLTIDEWRQTRKLAPVSDVVIVASGVVNTYAYAVNDLLPLRFARLSDTKHIADCIFLLPTQQLVGEHHLLDTRHCGLVLLCKSPFNLKKKMLWIAGISGLGTGAAALCATMLVQSPERVLGSLECPVGCIVVPAIPSGESPSEHRGGRGVSSFQVKCILENGKVLWRPEGDTP